MKRTISRRLLSATTVVLFSVAGVLAGGAAASAADAPPAPPPPPKPPKTFFENAETAMTVITTAYQIYSAAQHFNGVPNALEQATAQIINAVNQAKVELESEIDTGFASEVNACRDSVLADVENLPTMTSNYLDGYVLRATDCVTKAKNLIHDLSNATVVNQVAFALNIVGPIALVARARAGLKSVALTQNIIDGNRAAIVRLEPACEYDHIDERGFEFYEIACTAFNGERVAGTTNLFPIDYTVWTHYLMKSTSYGEALQVLPMMTGAPTVGAITQTYATGTCMDVYFANTQNGTEVRPQPCNGSGAQRWTVGAEANTVRALGKCLDVAGGSTAAGTKVQLWDCNGGAGQQWLRTSSNGLVNPRSGLCLDASRGTNVSLRIAFCDGLAYQRWNVTDQDHGSPIAVARGGVGTTGKLEVVGTNSANAIVHASQTTAGVSTSLSGWEVFDGGLRSVASDTNADGRVEVFGVNGAGQIFNKWQTAAGGPWSAGWNPFAGTLSSIAVAHNQDGQLQVFGTNSVGAVVHMARTPAGWGGWTTMEGQLRNIAAETNAAGRVELVGTNFLGQIFHRVQTVANSDTWSPWTQLPGELSSIALARNQDGRLEIFGANSAGVPVHSVETAGNTDTWQPWQTFGGAVTQVAADTNSDGRIELFGVNSAGQIFHLWQQTPGGAWTDWSQIGGTLRP
jgi:hypothetical protein